MGMRKYVVSGTSIAISILAVALIFILRAGMEKSVPTVIEFGKDAKWHELGVEAAAAKTGAAKDATTTAALEAELKKKRDEVRMVVYDEKTKVKFDKLREPTFFPAWKNLRGVVEDAKGAPVVKASAVGTVAAPVDGAEGAAPVDGAEVSAASGTVAASGADATSSSAAPVAAVPITHPSLITLETLQPKSTNDDSLEFVNATLEFERLSPKETREFLGKTADDKTVPKNVYTVAGFVLFRDTKYALHKLADKTITDKNKKMDAYEEAMKWKHLHAYTYRYPAPNRRPKDYLKLNRMASLQELDQKTGILNKFL